MTNMNQEDKEERLEDLKHGIEEVIELKVPITVNLRWSEKNQCCQLKWWSEEFMQDAIWYYIDSEVETATEDLRKKIKQEVEQLKILRNGIENERILPEPE